MEYDPPGCPQNLSYRARIRPERGQVWLRLSVARGYLTLLCLQKG